MTELSPTAAERARNAHSELLQAMQEPGSQKDLARAIGWSESHVSRTKADLADVLTMIYQLGHKVVPEDHLHVEPQSYDFMTALHQRVVEDAPHLLWGVK